MDKAVKQNILDQDRTSIPEDTFFIVFSYAEEIDKIDITIIILI